MIKFKLLLNLLNLIKILSILQSSTPIYQVVDNSFTRGKLSELDRKESGIQGTSDYEEYSPYDLLPQENVKLYGQEETAKPYGALSDAFQGETNMNSKEVVLDEKSKAIIVFLN